VAFQTEGIDPGQYTGRIILEATTPNVEGNPVIVDLALTVNNVITALPASAAFIYYPCAEPLPIGEQEIQLSASTPLTYSAQIEGNPTWVTVSPEGGVLPESVRVTVDPSQRPADIVTLDLLVSVDTPNEPGIVNRIPIHFACPSNRSHIPIISKQ
jgi:hypothetical protein